MSDATDALQAMIDSVARISTLVDDAMSDITEAVRAEQKRTIADGMTPYGEKWKPTKQGTPPLQHADKTLTVMAVNRTVYITIFGADARHHLGRGRGKVKRGVIPERGLPSAMANSIRAVLSDHFNDAVQQQ